MTLTYDENTGVGMKQYPVFIPFGFRDAQEAELRKLAYPFEQGQVVPHQDPGYRAGYQS